MAFGTATPSHPLALPPLVYSATHVTQPSASCWCFLREEAPGPKGEPRVSWGRVNVTGVLWPDGPTVPRAVRLAGRVDDRGHTHQNAKALSWNAPGT